MYFSSNTPNNTAFPTGVDGPVYALEFCTWPSNPNLLIAGGTFSNSWDGSSSTPPFNPLPLRYIGYYPISASFANWSILGNATTPGGALNNTVRAIAINNSNGYVYAGGDFTNDLDFPQLLYNIAYYPLTGMSWFQMDSSNPGTNGTGTVYALSFDTNTGDLWVGGSFTQMGPNAQNDVAQWNPGTTSWISTSFPNSGDGTDGAVFSITNYTNTTTANFDVAIGGSFTTITSVGSPTSVNNITYGPQTFNGSIWFTNSWNQLYYTSNGFSNGSDSVKALAYLGSDLYVGGTLSTVGSNPNTVNNIVKWIGLSPTNGYWEPLLFAGQYGLNNIVFALASDGSYMYTGGQFLNTTSGYTLNFIGRWTNPSTWSQITYSSDIGLNNPVYSLEFDVTVNQMLVGGSFTSTGSTSLALANITKIDTSLLTFSQVININYYGTSGPTVYAVLSNSLSLTQTYRYLGGNFSTTFPTTTTTLNNMAVILPPSGTLTINGSFSFPIGGILSSITSDYYDETTHLIYDVIDGAWLLANGPYSAPIPIGNYWADYLYWDDLTDKWTVGSDRVRIGQNSGQTVQYNGCVAIGFEAGRFNQNPYSVAIGYQTAYTQQGQSSVAIGTLAGAQNQGGASIALGQGAGQTFQGGNSIAIGAGSACTHQGVHSIAMGTSSGQYTQGGYAIALGYEAGNRSQGSQGIAIGLQAGRDNQNSGAISIGQLAGTSGQNQYAIAIGVEAGSTNQGTGSIAIGYEAGFSGQLSQSIAIGWQAGSTRQQSQSIAIGWQAGLSQQGAASIAIGYQAGFSAQLSQSIAIGYQAGSTRQGQTSIAIGWQAGASNQLANSVAIG